MLCEEPDEEFVETGTGQSNKYKNPVFEVPVFDLSFTENPDDTQNVI
jgi:hypothetical protein